MCSIIFTEHSFNKLNITLMKKHKINEFISAKEVLRQVAQLKRQKPDEKMAESATKFYSWELFHLDLNNLSKFEVDLTEFEGEI